MRNIYRATYLFLLKIHTITIDNAVAAIINNIVYKERLPFIFFMYFIDVVIIMI